MTFKHLPDWAPMAAITIFGTVYIKDRYLDRKDVTEHEAVHVRQQTGFFRGLWFYISYLLLLPLFWNPFRRDLEAEAYAVSVKYGIGFDQAVRSLSGSMYGWCCTRAAAERAIKRYM